MKPFNQVRIKVIGIGGAGCNAVNYLHKEQHPNVHLVACNTDEGAVSISPDPDKLLIGDTALLEHAGAGGPEVCRQLALRKEKDIQELLSDHAEIVFVVAGMGGSAGTGAAPVFARIAKELGLLTIGIVTTPFAFEGVHKVAAASEGIEVMKKYTDSLLILSNDKLRAQYGNLPVKEAFGKADEFIADTVHAIADVVSISAEVNVDIDDVKTVLGNAGPAVVGTAVTSGADRAMIAAEKTLAAPFLVNGDVWGAKKVLLSIMSGMEAELDMEELTLITEYIQEKAGPVAEIIFGHGVDGKLDNSIRVTMIATGFSDN